MDRTIIAIPPGITIKEHLRNIKMTQKEFSRRMGMSEKHISRLLNGDVLLTQEVAVNLEMVTGIPAHFWNNLETIYREKLAKIEAMQKMKNDIEILKEIPYEDLVLNKWIEGSETDEERVIEVRKFFEVADLKILSRTLFPVNLNKSRRDLPCCDYEELILICKTRREARDIESNVFSIRKMRRIINRFIKRGEVKLKEDREQVSENLKSCGICIIFTEIEKNAFTYMKLKSVVFREGKRFVIGKAVGKEEKEIYWDDLISELSVIESEYKESRNKRQLKG